MGRFDYPTVTTVRHATNPSAEYWAGICHGWSPAAINPRRTRTREPGRREWDRRTFRIRRCQSADRHSYYANNAKPTHFLGAKCNSNSDSDGNPIHAILSPFLPYLGTATASTQGTRSG